MKWGNVSEADAYLVYAGYCGKSYDKPITVKDAGKTSLKLSKLGGKAIDLKQNYKFYIKAVKYVDGKTVTLGKTITAHIVGSKNTKYTNPKAIKLAKTSMSVSVKKTAKISAKVTVK